MGGGGGGIPPATLMAGNAKEADTSILIWPESVQKACGKFKDLVCLVSVFMLNETLCITSV